LYFSPKRPEKKEKSVGKEKKSSKLRRGKSAKDAKEEKVEVKEEAAEAAVKAGDDNEEVGKNDTETAEQGVSSNHNFLKTLITQYLPYAQYLNPYIFVTSCVRTMNSARSKF